MARRKTRHQVWHQVWQQAPGSRLYRGTQGARLWRGLAVVATLTAAFCGAGCSLSSQFDSVFASSDTTGSITPLPGAKQSEELPPAVDMAYAKAAVSEVLRHGRKDASQPWENPTTGARGTVTPIASAYSQGGITCHDFLASYVKGASQAWLQGEACKTRSTKNAEWEIRSIKPWKRT